MTFGYARVSTKTQARDGNSLEAQQAALTAAGAEKIYTDTFTGTKIERPEFDRLRAQLRRGDVLIVTRLDRLARSVSQASGLITEMIDEGITINVLNLLMAESRSLPEMQSTQRLHLHWQSHRTTIFSYRNTAECHWQAAARK